MELTMKYFVKVLLNRCKCPKIWHSERGEEVGIFDQGWSMLNLYNIEKRF